MLSRINNAFALWLAIGLAWAWFVPSHFIWFRAHIPLGLGIIMLGMGLTLRFADFRAALKTPWIALMGIIAQFVIMPAAGWAVARWMQLPPPMAVGLILVACCPGGTASNVITHLAGGNLPLSVLMTTCSTFAAVGLTPLLTDLFAGAQVPVPVGDMLLDMATVVILPILAGLVANHFLGASMKKIAPATPLVSIFFIILIVGAIVGGQKKAVSDAVGTLLLAVFIVHGIGFAMGYFVARLCGLGARDARTVSIEVGMQNSGLGAKLAATHFTNPLIPVPAALSAVCHCIIGSALAAWWRRSTAPR
ncbi:MAG: bile acid:sodium symporter family protein [Prosthecobacter sp.]